MGNARDALQIDRALNKADLDNYLKKTSPDKVSAENNALHRELKSEDRIVFYCSDSDADVGKGERCGRALRRHYDRRDHEAEVIKVPELDPAQKGRAFERGLHTFLRMLAKRIKEERKEGRAVLVNATGGFKSQTSLATLMGVMHRVPVYYIFETGTQNIRLPALPVSWDRAFQQSYEEVLYWLVEDPRPREEVEQRVAGLPHEELFWNLLVENEEGLFELSIVGYAVAGSAPSDERESEVGPPVLLSEKARDVYHKHQGTERGKNLKDLVEDKIPNDTWRDERAHPVGGGAFVAPGNPPGQGQGDDERVAFAMRGRRVLVCELFPHHMRGTSEGKAFGRLKREGFDPGDYRNFELLDAFS